MCVCLVKWMSFWAQFQLHDIICPECSQEHRNCFPYNNKNRVCSRFVWMWWVFLWTCLYGQKHHHCDDSFGKRQKRRVDVREKCDSVVLAKPAPQKEKCFSCCISKSVNTVIAAPREFWLFVNRKLYWIKLTQKPLTMFPGQQDQVWRLVRVFFALSVDADKQRLQWRGDVTVWFAADRLSS